MEDLPDTLTPSVDVPWGRLVPCLKSLDPVDLHKQSFKIGRSQICDMVLNDSLMELNRYKGTIISKKHCVLTKEADNMFYITDFSKNGTFVNGANIGKGQKVALKHNDKIGCYNASFFVFKSVLVEPDLPSTSSPSGSKSLSLTPKRDNPWGRLIAFLVHFESFDLCGPTFRVGTSPYCDAIIRKVVVGSRVEKFFSKEHFMLIKDPDTLITYITDLSHSGTYLNDHLIGKHCKNILQDNDIIAVGPRKMRVYLYKSLHSSNSQSLPEELRKKYELSTLLGKGGCGEVRLAYHKRTCKAYAIKSIMKARSTTSQMDKLNHPIKIRTEIKILRDLSHPFVIKMKDIVETQDEFFIVLEYMRGGELHNRISSTVPLMESHVKFFFYQMVLAVQYLHLKGITHRDLKPQNVLLSTEDPETLLKVSDFGLSKIAEGDDMMQTMCGTLCYIAPEILDTRVSEYNKQVDVWSLGVILFYMLSQNASDKIVTTKLIQMGDYTMEAKAWNGVSFQARDLVRKMLVVDPKKRITIREILKHPWLEKDVSMQYRLKSMLDLPCASQNEIVICNMEPPTKRVRLSSDESTE